MNSSIDQLFDDLETTVVENKAQTPAKSYPTQDILALSYAAFRRNNYEYIRDTRRFSTEGDKPIYSNKELIRYTIDYRENRWIPDDFTPLKTNQEDYDNVEKCQKHFKKYTILSLGNLSEFERCMFELMATDTQEHIDGRIAYIPQFVLNDEKQHKLRKTIRMDYRNSRHIDKPLEPVEGTIKILDRVWSNRFERYNYVAALNEDLVSFLNSKRYDIGLHLRLKGRVKYHLTNRLFDVPETRLNYVRLKLNHGE